MLQLKNLSVKIGENNLLENINLEVKPGEIHAIMGPKHSGKTNLALSIMGNPNFEYSSGSITYKRKSIAGKDIDKKVQSGIYVSFQYPPTIGGISNFELAFELISRKKATRTQNELKQQYKEYCKQLGLSRDHGDKIINNEIMPMSECKKNEILQMSLLDPELVVLDEVDEESDLEEIKLLGCYIKKFLNKKNKSAVIITHSQELLDILKPTHVHIMINGTIREHGDKNFYKRIVKDDYSQFSQS